MDIASLAASLDHDLLDADWEEQERGTYSSEDELLSPAEGIYFYLSSDWLGNNCLIVK